MTRLTPVTDLLTSIPCLSDPPRINGSGVPAEVSVVVNHVLELVCEADGIPLPTLTWLKDGRPLPQTDSIRLLRDGEVLRVASAQVGNKNVVSKWAVAFLSCLSCCSVWHKCYKFLNHIVFLEHVISYVFSFFC